MHKVTNVNDDEAFVIEAKEIRGGLLRRLEQASSASELAEFQALLTDEIVRTEARRKNDRRQFAFKEHILRLRLLGDSLAWRLLHPHAIRNLAKNDGLPPMLYDRRRELEKCIGTVRWLSSKGIPATVSDLTHCLRIGDVIIVRHSEMPDIVESKATVRDDRYRHQGRTGRQRHRMQKTAEYLNHGSAVFRDEQVPRLAMEIRVHPEHDFAQVESVASTAIRDGASVQLIRPRQWLGPLCQ
jgi:uncharacterized small protein (DUF1192 family)